MGSQRRGLRRLTPSFGTTVMFVVAIAGIVYTSISIVTLLYHDIRHHLQARREMTDGVTLFQVSFALSLYHDTHGHYPPAYVMDDHGTPIHSWRALLLPWLAGDERDREVERAYRFDEPWNGPNNSLLHDRAPWVLRPQPHLRRRYEWASVVALLGPHGVLSEKERVTRDSLTRPREDMIMLVHVPEGFVPWLKPRDLPFFPPGGAAYDLTGDTPFAALPDDPVILFADNEVFKIRRDVDFAAVGQRTRDELIDLGIVYPRLLDGLSPSTWLVLPLAITGTVCVIVAVAARRALRRARSGECSIP